MLKSLTKNEKKLISFFSEKSSEEVCGAIVKPSVGGRKIFPLKNISKQSEVHFLTNFYDVENLKKVGKILAFYHSHPSSSHELSEEDIFISNKTQYSTVVYSKVTKKFSIYNPIDEPVPLLNRPFVLGTLDCTQLALDYYKEVLNIELVAAKPLDLRFFDFFNGDKENSEFNSEKFMNIFPDYFKSMGFRDVSDLKEHDLIFFSGGGIIPYSHCSVYLGNGILLDQPLYKKSTHRNIKKLIASKGIFKKTSKIMRH
jgi:proteasome lid subunit RPN8/RPN11